MGDSARTVPDDALEAAARARGALRIAGVDEVGRGPLAGPVVVAAVILLGHIPAGLNDSKLLTAGRRERLYEEIVQHAAVSVVAAPPRLIGTLNILQATLWAMRQAVMRLPVAPDHVLVDGNVLPKGLACSGEAVIGGDGRSISIAAASIVAKVTRDRMCAVMHREEPQFGFDSHKGYGAPVHLRALDEHGPGRYHRMGYAPCAAAAERRAGRVAAA